MAMNPSLTAAGGRGLHALLHLLGVHPAGSGDVPPARDLIDPALAAPAGADYLQAMCSLNECQADSSNPDVSLCKLSLTLDATRPRVKKGPFGHDFQPFM
jgi:hypothetical protein